MSGVPIIYFTTQKTSYGPNAVRLNMGMNFIEQIQTLLLVLQIVHGSLMFIPLTLYSYLPSHEGNIPLPSCFDAGGKLGLIRSPKRGIGGTFLTKLKYFRGLL
jgi:hypothetical protein